MSFFKPTPKSSDADSSRSANSPFVGVQAKLNIGKSNDKYEREADAVADKVVNKDGVFGNQPFLTPSPSVQRSEDQELQKSEETEQIQEKPIAGSITPLVQRKEDEEVQQKAQEEALQMKSDEELQQKEEEEVQTKEEEIQKQSDEEPVQKQQDENDIQQKQSPEHDTGEALAQRKAMETSSVGDVSSIQRKDDEIQEKEEEIQEKEDEEKVQRSASADTGDTSNLENNLSSSKGGGNPMDQSTRSQMESGFGADFSGVRIHNDANAVQMNKDLGAQAFANGNDIYFNEGKYDPASKDGQHLLAHELTHTIQQGASSQSNVQKAAAEPTEAPATKPTTPLDITHRLDITDAWAKYLDAENKKKAGPREVDVKIGERFYGTIELSRKKGTASGEVAKYEITKGTKKNFLNINGWSFLQPLRDAGFEPVLFLNNFGDEQITTGFLTVAKGGVAVKVKNGFIDSLNANLDKMGFLGLSPIKVGEGFENTFELGRLLFQVGAMTTVVDGFLEAGGGMGITGDTFTFNVNAKVDVAGLASGELMLARGESGKLSGKLDIEADIANVNAKLMVEYIEGAVTIQGSGKIQSEKFSGEITLLVTDKAKSKQMMNAALGVETMDAEKDQAENPAAAPILKTKDNQVLAGWGEVTANITPWLTGTAKVGIDSEGHVTIVGEITVDNEVELMEQRGKKVDLFKVEIRAGYGIPLVGQVFLFASIGMFMNAGFGPIVLKNIGFKGTYSTDPSVLQEFEITGTLNLNAFAIIGLEAEAGVGITILGHDIKAGVNVTAAAGLRAYAEATPTLEYKEQQSPEGGKVGESRLKGHFEAAAQLFMQLSGSLFYELDSPWWSPAPDGREDFPLGEVQYPIGDSMGIGADMDWLIGSPDIPELKFSPVEFDPDKFTADVMADPPPGKKGKSDENKPGQWEDKNQPSDKKDTPETKDGKGIEGSDKKKEDLKNLPDEQKYMRSLDEMSKLEKADPKPTLAVVEAKAKKVKSKYGIDSITVKDKKDQAEISVKHKKENNGKNLLKVPLMSAAERYKLLKTAMDDLNARNKKAGGEKGTISQADAEKLITDWKKAHPVVEEVRVVDGGTTWDYFIDIGDKSNTEKGNRKEGAEISAEDVKKHEKIASEIHDAILSNRTAQKGQTAEELRKEMLIKAEELQKVYSPKLKEGIGLFITLTEENGIFQLRVLIKPNDTDKSYKVLPKIGEFDLFDLYVEMALNMATDEIYMGGNKPATSNEEQDFEEKRDKKIESSRGYEGATDSASEKELINQEREKRIEEIESKLSSPIEKVLAKLQTDYNLAYKAKHLGNNILTFAGVRLFIDQARNYYVYPMKEMNEEPIIDGNGDITVPNEVPGFEYAHSRTTLDNWVYVLDQLTANPGYKDHDHKKIAFMTGGFGAEPHRYAPNHITHLIAIARIKAEGSSASGNAVNTLHLVGTKDPVATGEIKERLRKDRLNVIQDNPELRTILRKIFEARANLNTNEVQGHYLLDNNQKSPKNSKQFDLTNDMKNAIIKYIQANLG